MLENVHEWQEEKLTFQSKEWRCTEDTLKTSPGELADGILDPPFSLHVPAKPEKGTDNPYLLFIF